MPSDASGIWRRNRFTFLLAAFLLLVAAIPLARAVAYPQIAQLIVKIAFLLLLVVGGLASAHKHSTRIGIVSLAGLVAVFFLWAEISDSPMPQIGAYTASLIILGVVAILTIRALFADRNVTRDTLAASLCGYVVIGVAWAAAYSLLERLQSGAFQYSTAEFSAEGMRFAFGESAQALYFSFVTITTLGYGDIVPVSSAARLLSALEAFLGQAYIAVLVARLVGLYIVSESDRLDS